jgi:hypothetical protein
MDGACTRWRPSALGCQMHPPLPSACWTCWLLFSTSLCSSTDVLIYSCSPEGHEQHLYAAALAQAQAPSKMPTQAQTQPEHASRRSTFPAWRRRQPNCSTQPLPSEHQGAALPGPAQQENMQPETYSSKMKCSTCEPDQCMCSKYHDKGTKQKPTGCSQPECTLMGQRLRAPWEAHRGNKGHVHMRHAKYKYSMH